MCYDFTDEDGGFVDLLHWAMEHVAANGYIAVSLPYPRYLPSIVKRFIARAWPKHRVVLEEIVDRKRSLVVARQGVCTWDSIYIENRTEVGDTMCLVPLLKALRTERPEATVHVRYDPHNMLRPLGAVVSDEIPSHCCGVFHQTPYQHESAEYYRRSDDFFYYPIRMAKILGWLTGEYPVQPEIPQIGSVATNPVPFVDYVVVAPEANMRLRMWKRDRWYELVTWLLQNGQHVVVVGRNSFNYELSVAKDRFLNLVGKTTLDEVGSVIAGARYVIGCDSSPGHIAAAHGVRFIVLEGPTIGVFRSELIRQVSRQDDGCVNCMNNVGDRGPYPLGKQYPMVFCGCPKDPPCMDAITVDQVKEAVLAEHGIVSK